jgi:hypothetical protein
MGFFSPGFIIGAASSLSNQIETAQERNAAEMERRRNQFDILSRETKRELRKKRQSQEEQAAALETLIGQYPEGKAILSAIGDDTASRAGLYRDFAQRKQFDRNFSPKNFALSVFRSGMIEDGSFDPSKVVSVTKPVPMDDLEETGESFIETFGRKLTGAPSARELQETDVSRLSSDIPEATVKIEKVYNPLSFEDPAWNRAFKSFADTEGIQLGMTPTGQYSLENLQKAKGDVQNKLRIINTLRQYQAYTEDDIGGITGDVKDIYEVVQRSGDQFDTIVTQIAKDMNETSVSEVLENLNKYAPKADGGDGGVGRGTSGAKPVSESSSQDLAKILKEQVPEDAIPVGRTKEGDPIFIVVIDGVERRVANVAGSPYLVQ